MFKQEINAVKQHFQEKNYHASDGWLHDCVSWAMTNNSPQENTIPKLHDFAYQQWLLGNLREMSPGCLPPNLQQQRLVILKGKYSLQAEKIIDVSNPKYTQLKISKGGVIEREEEPEDEETISELTEWGQGPQETGGKLRPRKLMLHLCDGKQEIRGLEYKTLPKLRGMIFPGIKLHVIGPIECRRGVLMLEPKHLIVLGGEIDTLMVTNAPINVLARQLGLPENPDPYKEVQSTIPEPRKEGPPTRTQNTTKFTSSASTVIGLSQATKVSGHKPNVLNKSNDYKHTQESARRVNNQNNRTNTVPSVTSNQKRSLSKPQTLAMDCDDMDDFDLTEEDLLALEKQSNLTMQSSKSHQPVKKSQPTSSIPTKPVESCDEEYLEVDLDDLEYQILASNSAKINPSSINNVSTYQQLKPGQNVGASGNSKAVSSSISKAAAIQPYVADSKNKMNFASTTQASNTTNAKLSLTKPSINKPVKSNQSALQHLEEMEHDDDIWQDVSNQRQNKITPQNKHNAASLLSVKKFKEEIPEMSNLNSTVSQARTTQGSRDPPSSTMNRLAGVPNNHSITSQQVEQNSPPSKKLKGLKSDIRLYYSSSQSSVAVPEKPARAPQLAKPKLSDFLEKTSCRSASVEQDKPTQVIPKQQQVSRWPFVYLRQLKDPEDRPHQAVVKASVVTVLKKLYCTEGVWRLELRITDGSDNLDVVFSNEVLESFIGLSVAEVVQLKKEAIVNPLAKERLTELSMLKKKLIDLVCLMEIEFSKDQMPQVVQLTNLNESHLTELNSRQLKS